MKENKWLKNTYDECGGALGFVVILILSVTLIGSATIALAKRQLMISMLGRQTFNSYHLARSGAEKTIDTMNKEIAMAWPRLMEEANIEVHKKLLAEDTDGITYQYGEDVYAGKYVGRENENQYKLELRKSIYNYIIESFINSNKANRSYQVFLDNSHTMPTKIVAKLYSNHSNNIKKIPEDIANIVNSLATENNIGVTSDNKDVFVIEVVASIKEVTNKTLVSSRVVGTIGLEGYLKVDGLLEEYEWAKDYEGGIGCLETLSGGFVSFGGIGESDTYIQLENSFHNLINLSVFDVNNEWSYNNPIYITSKSEEIELSDFSEIPTAIICREENTTITLKGTGVFNGIIMTPGKVEIAANGVINGTIIAGNEYAGVNDVEIKYDPDMLFKIRFMDKSLQRKLYDSLRITNYEGLTGLATKGSDKEQEKIDVIMGKKHNRIIQLSPKSIIHSEGSGLKFVMKSLRKL